MLLKTYSKKNMVKVYPGGRRKLDTVITYQRTEQILVVTTPDGHQFVLPFDETFYAVKLLKSMSQKEKYEKPI